jgi:hypothetical protein
VFIVNQRFKQQFEESSRRQLDAAKLRFQHEQLNHLNQLNFRFQSLAREPKYFAAFRTLNPNTIQKQLAAMVENEDLAKEGVAFISFAPADISPPVIQMRINLLSIPAVVAGCEASVKSALTNAALPDTVHIGTNLFNVVSVPLFSVDGDQIIGALAFGEEVGLPVA